MNAQLWLAVAWIFIAVKLASTAVGLRLKWSGTIFSSRKGWAIYTLSKISPVILCLALYENAVFSHDTLNAGVYFWLAVFAAVLASAVVALKLGRSVSAKS